jgi:hypothetical protein
MLIGEGKDVARRCRVLCLSLRYGVQQIVGFGNVSYTESLLSYSPSIEHSHLVDRFFSFSRSLNTPSRLRLLAMRHMLSASSDALASSRVSESEVIPKTSKLTAQM